jgi:opacity protein-like surface antigen
MSFVTRLLTARKGAVPASMALIAGVFGSSAAWAQCTTTLPPIAGAFLPFVQSGAVNSLVSSINMVNTAFLTQSTAFVSAPGGPRPDQQGGGAWGRVIGGSVDTDSKSNATADLTAIFGPGATGTTNCSTTSRTDFAGFQVGHDISVLNGGGTGANFHVGVTAGYIKADSKDITPGASFSNSLDVPFAGVYAAFTKGAFFADAQVRWDAYQNNVTDPSLGFGGQQFNATGWSLTGNAGYNIPLHNNWFVEPSAGVVWSTVQVDPLSVAGPAGALPARVTIDDIDSVLGRLSVRVGTTVTHGNILFQPFVTASVLHEFADDVHTRVSANNFGMAGPAITADISTSRVGTYGQFALGSAAVLSNTGWLGYARVDYRIGENIEGWSVNGGLRYQFSPEQRAGGLKDAPMPVSYAYNWTGPYIGGFAGKLWGDQSWNYVGGGGTVQDAYASYIAGGQAGYNVQLGRIVLGVEADYGFSNSHGGVPCPNAAFFTCNAEVDNLMSVTGRAGVTWERALFYVKGGFAGGDVRVETKFNLGGPIPPSGTPTNGTTSWESGWTAGGGMEFALSQQWSARAEYMHYDLGSDRYTVDNGLLVDAKTKGDTVRVGVNFHLHSVREPEPLK